MLCRMPIGWAPLRRPKKTNASSRSSTPTTRPPYRIARVRIPFYPPPVRLAPFALPGTCAAVTMTHQGGAMKYLKIGGTWILTILLAVLMVGPGSQKFMGPTWERMFRVWGYPDGFYLEIGRA